MGMRRTLTSGLFLNSARFVCTIEGGACNQRVLGGVQRDCHHIMRWESWHKMGGVSSSLPQETSIAKNPSTSHTMCGVPRNMRVMRDIYVFSLIQYQLHFGYT